MTDKKREPNAFLDEEAEESDEEQEENEKSDSESVLMDTEQDDHE